MRNTIAFTRKFHWLDKFFLHNLIKVNLYLSELVQIWNMDSSTYTTVMESFQTTRVQHFKKILNSQAKLCVGMIRHP